MLELLSDDIRRDPYPLFAQLRSTMPVFREPNTGLWFVLDYDSAKRALTDHEHFSSAVTPPTGRAPDWLIFNDPPRHTQLRAIIGRAFTPRSIANLEPLIAAISEELLDELLDEALERGTLDLATDYAGPLPVMVIAAMLGIPLADRARFIRWSEVIMNLSHSASGGPTAVRHVQEHAAVLPGIRQYLHQQLESRRTRPQEDLLTRMLQAEMDGRHLTEDEILGFFQLLIAAGTETTTNLIDNAILCFLEHPEQLARVRADRSLLPSCIEEVVRYRSPAAIAFREARQPVELRGQQIAPKELMLVSVGAANRDPSAFPDPDRFDVCRTPNPHLGFGHGIHYCIGAPLARIEAKVALTHLLDRLETFELATSEPWQPRQALNVHGPRHLPLRISRRRSA